MRSIVISAVSAVALLSGAALANDQAAESASSGVTAGTERSMDCTPGTNDPDCDDMAGPLEDGDHSAGATSGSLGSTGDGTAGATGNAGTTESTGSTGGTGSTATGGTAGGTSAGGASSTDD